MIEASSLKKIVINSNCPSGPKEFFKNGKNGFLFKNNNSTSLINTFDRFMSSKKKDIDYYKVQNYKKSLEYSEIEHAKKFNQLLKSYEKK